MAHTIVATKMALTTVEGHTRTSGDLEELKYVAVTVCCLLFVTIALGCVVCVGVTLFEH